MRKLFFYVPLVLFLALTVFLFMVNDHKAEIASSDSFSKYLGLGRCTDSSY